MPLTLNKWLFARFGPCTWCHALKQEQSLNCFLLFHILWDVSCVGNTAGVSVLCHQASVCRYRICCFLCSVWWQALIILTRQHVALCFRRPHSLQFLCGWTFVFIAGRPLWCDEILLKRSVISVSVKDAHTSEVTRVRISSPLNKTNPFTIWTSLWLQQMATSKRDIFFLHTCLILSKQTWWKSDLHRYRPLCGCVCVLTLALAGLLSEQIHSYAVWKSKNSRVTLINAAVLL